MIVFAMIMGVALTSGALILLWSEEFREIARVDEAGTVYVNGVRYSGHGYRWYDPNGNEAGFTRTLRIRQAKREWEWKRSNASGDAS